MKIGIYAKHLSTLGGGEKVALVAAEALSKRGHDVDIISAFEVEQTDLEKAMGVDLEGVRIIPWFDRSYEKLTPKTKKYDVFINSSFLDHTPSIAKRSLYYILFPTPMKETFLGFIKYEKLLPFLRNFLVIPEISKGITPVDDIFSRGGKWLDEDTTIVISNVSKKFRLRLRIYYEEFNFTSVGDIEFSSKNSELILVDKVVEHQHNILTYTYDIQPNKGGNVVINIKPGRGSRSSPVALVSLTVFNFRYFAWNLIKRLLPRYEMALYGSSSYKPSSGLKTYDTFLADSEYTRKWTKRYWGKESVVLYPPVDTHEFKPGKKRNIILSVGRFFVEGHSKRQDVLVNAFRQMIDEGLLGKSWELHLVGGMAGGAENIEFIEKIKRNAEGYKIHFHHYATFDELKKLYSQAKIYWHATGYGVNEKINPIGMEHFGITPVEAMAAGCVPIVFRGGGLTETVEEDSGFTWKSVAELIKITKSLIENPARMRRFSTNAIARAKNFSREKFIKGLFEAIDS